MTRQVLKVTDKTTLKAIEEADKKGDALLFDLERFKVLPKEFIQKLSIENVMAYGVSKEAHRKRTESLDDPPLPAYAITPTFASARKQLKVDNLDPKFHYCFKRPDEIGQCLAIGYVFVYNTEVNGFNYDASGRIIVGVIGHVELYLMKTPVENYEAIMRESEEDSRRRNGAVEDTAIEKIGKQGVKAVKVKGD